MPAVDTRERLLEVAEELFATRGVAEASLRDITGAAEANLSAVNYHFGSKEGLLRAIVEARAEPLTETRLRLLELAEEAAASSPPTVHSILRAFIEPVLEMRERHPHFPALMGRVLSENLMPVVGDVFRRTFYESLLRFADALSRAVPEVPLDEIRSRLFFTVGAFHFVIRAQDTVCAVSGEEAVPFADLGERLIAFCEAGLRAPAAKEGS